MADAQTVLAHRWPPPHKKWSPTMIVAIFLLTVSRGYADGSLELKITGDWRVEIAFARPAGQRQVAATVSVSAPKIAEVQRETYGHMPVFDPKAPGWKRGVVLRGLQAQECSATGLLEPTSVLVTAAVGDPRLKLERGKDYELDPTWATLGRLPRGRIGPEDDVAIAYRYAMLRLDSIILREDGRIVLREGTPHVVAPLPPALQKGEQRLANVWIPGAIERLGPEHLFPVLETAYPETPQAPPSPAQRLLPKTLQKLRSGEPLRILAWGDSVTDAGYLPDREHQRWQTQFVERLQAAFPKAKIELLTEAWGGRNTVSYLAEPPGSVHNYQQKVLGAKPDLIVSEFVNDAGLTPEQVEQRYSRLLADFRGIGAEWIILTPHYVRPDWMGLNRERQIDEDPRPYVAGLRQFAAKHKVALADASRRWGRLWRQGLPYRTLLLNGINHPDVRGMRLFADSLMELFP